jgi:hypothetical protein
MRIKIGNQWYKVIGETTIFGVKHFEVEHVDDGQNKVTGWIPWWMPEETCENVTGDDPCGCSACHSLHA